MKEQLIQAIKESRYKTDVLEKAFLKEIEEEGDIINYVYNLAEDVFWQMEKTYKEKATDDTGALYIYAEDVMAADVLRKFMHLLNLEALNEKCK